MSNKRVHEIAKERGLATKDVLARLKEAGIDVKASSSSVDEEVASRVLANGGQARAAAASAPAANDKPSTDSPKAKADRRPAQGQGRRRRQAVHRRESR